MYKVTKQTLPGAWICTNDPSLSYPNHGRKSTQHSKIYLNDGEEFEIELYNPLSENVLAVITLDGKPISKSGLIVRAGQRFYLDCFYDDRKKFVFKTYEVDNTSEVKDAIAKNGLIEIQFFKEKILKKYDADTVVHHHHHYNWPTWRPYWNGWYNGFYYVNGTADTSSAFNMLRSSHTTNINAVNTTTTNALYNNSTLTSSNAATYSTNFSSNLSNATQDSYANATLNEDINEGTKLRFTSSSSKMETGQIDKGESSNQTFQSIEMDFEDNMLNKIIYNLLPESRKPAELNNSFVANSKKIKLNADDIELNGNVKINGTAIGVNKVEQLLELKGMLESNLITASEFETLKKELLS